MLEKQRQRGLSSALTNMLTKKSAHWHFAKQAAELRLQGNKTLIKKYIKLWPELQKWANGLKN